MNNIVSSVSSDTGFNDCMHSFVVILNVYEDKKVRNQRTSVF